MKPLLSFICVALFAFHSYAADFLAVPGNALWGEQVQSPDIPDIPTSVPVSAEFFASNTLKSDAVLKDPIIQDFPNYPYGDIFYHGGLSFKLEGRAYSLKLGFRRGHYDDYVKTYKTKRVLFFSEVTDFIAGDWPDISSQLLDIIDGDKHGALSFSPVSTGAAEKFKFIYSAGCILIYLYNEKTGEETYLVDLTVRDLAKAWANDAERYAFTYDGRKIYAVPQLISDYSKDAEEFGYVLSENAPFHYTTALPLDFMALVRRKYSEDLFSYKPVGYSIPLGIAFEKRQENGWTLREIHPGELHDALNDEAGDTARRGGR